MIPASQLMEMYWAQEKHSLPTPDVMLSLKRWTGQSDSGQAAAPASAALSTVPVETVYQGKACCLFGPSSYWGIGYPFKPVGSQQPNAVHLTTAGWLAFDRSPTSGYDRKLFGVAVNMPYPTYRWLGTMQVGAAIKTGVQYSTSTWGGDGPKDADWHHYAMVLTMPAGWQYLTYSFDVYVDGVYMQSYTASHVANDARAYFAFGNPVTKTGHDVYMRDLRAYRHALSAGQIAEVYEEGL